MVFAAFRDDTYNLFLFLHIVAVVVTFAPAVINPMLERYFARSGGEPVLQNWAGFTATYTRTFSLGGLVVLLLTGIVMIILSDEVIEFSDTWISLSFLLWFAIGGVVSAMILKGEKQVAGGDMGGAKLIARGGAIATVLGLVVLYLMVFKPGA
ncbi:MAG: hypothetical protein ACLGIC_12485 [Acidimicrobiia bacterium]